MQVWEKQSRAVCIRKVVIENLARHISLCFNGMVIEVGLFFVSYSELTGNPSQYDVKNYSYFPWRWLLETNEKVGGVGEVLESERKNNIGRVRKVRWVVG